MHTYNTYIHTYIHTNVHTYIHTYIHTCTYIFVTDLNECGNRLNNFYPFGLEAQDTLSLNHSSDSIRNLNVLINNELFVSSICNYVL